jgi:hypothetical protein
MVRENAIFITKYSRAKLSMPKDTLTCSGDEIFTNFYPLPEYPVGKRIKIGTFSGKN